MEGELQYNLLIEVLKEIGETEFYIVENLGATVTNRNQPYTEVFSIDTPFQGFSESLKAIDPPFGFLMNHFYVFGRNPKWGIYICEHPTINIIGCSQDLTDKFRETFKITGTGIEEIGDFIDNEYQSNLELKKILLNNYRFTN